MFRTDPAQHLHVTSYTLCALLCVTSLVQCSVVSFNSSPASIKALMTDSLALRCGVRDGAPTGTSGIVGKRDVISSDHSIPSMTSFGHSSSDISKRDVKTSDIAIVSSISISISNIDLAAVTEHMAAKVFNNNNGGVHVTGNVTASGAERGFLQVTWDYPDSTHSGSYLCTVTGYDVDGHMHTLTETVVVGDNEVNLNDIVKYVHQLKLDNQQQNQLIEQQKQSIEQQKVINNKQKLVNDQQNQSIEQQKHDIEQQKQLIEQQKQLIEQQKQSIQQQQLVSDQQNQSIEHQKQSIEQQTTDISQLKGEISTLQKSNTDLTTHVNTSVIFSAYLSHDVTLSGGDMVVFDKLRTSHGQGYNTSTGFFKSTVSGYFMFHVHIEGQNKDKQAEVFLRYNNNHVAFGLGDDGVDLQTGSTSVAFLLHQGDTVYVISPGTSYLSGGSYGGTIFSGYLINLV